MKFLYKFAALIAVFLLPLHLIYAFSEFDIEACTIDSVEFEPINGETIGLEGIGHSELYAMQVRIAEQSLGVIFSVQSPEEGQRYPVAPPLKILVPERVEIQYRVNKCEIPAEDTQCEQFDRTIPASALHCNEQETSCRFEGGFDIPMTANRHYMLIVRPLPLHYDPIIIKFEFGGVAEAMNLKKRARVKQ